MVPSSVNRALMCVYVLFGIGGYAVYCTCILPLWWIASWFPIACCFLIACWSLIDWHFLVFWILGINFTWNGSVHMLQDINRLHLCRVPSRSSRPHFWPNCVTSVFHYRNVRTCTFTLILNNYYVSMSYQRSLLATDQIVWCEICDTYDVNSRHSTIRWHLNRLLGFVASVHPAFVSYWLALLWEGRRVHGLFFLSSRSWKHEIYGTPVA